MTRHDRPCRTVPIPPCRLRSTGGAWQTVRPRGGHDVPSDCLPFPMIEPPSAAMTPFRISLAPLPAAARRERFHG